MTKTIRSLVVLAAAVCMAGSMGFAQSAGEAIYKAKCQRCHGSTGTPSAGMAKMMGIKAASDPDIKKLAEADMIAAVKNGKGKMKARSPQAHRSADQGRCRLLPLVEVAATTAARFGSLRDSTATVRVTICPVWRAICWTQCFKNSAKTG